MLAADWPTTAPELLAVQRSLADAAPAPWRLADTPGRHADTPGRHADTPGRHADTPGRHADTPGPLADTPPAIGACAVLFPRGQTGRGERGDPAWAAAAVLRDQQVLAEASLKSAAAAPYLAGLLALREGPCLHAAVRALAQQPDVLLVDATGRDHPRRAGLALHLGAALELPTVGVTHRPLLATGTWPDDARGAHSPLLLDGRCVGAWLRTRAGARPLAVHPGWRTDLEVAIEVVLAATHFHRTPEPFRHARWLARVARAGDTAPRS